MDRRRLGRHRSRRETDDLEDIIYGVHAVDEALAAGEKLRKLHVGDERRRDPIVRRMLERAKAASVAVRFEDRGFFARFPYKAHQSVIAYGAPFPYTTVEELLAKPRSEKLLLVVLDHITDPHNAGAIVRTAECAGAHGVVLPERRSAGVNATVRKASAGATAADLDPAAVALVEADFCRDSAIVTGAEGAGLSQLARRECDYLVRIPMRGQVGSLNASVATGVLLYEALRQRAAFSS
ncbi:MAG: 23S rRNA (guanosine(2251)-2'-O)-methyltransferase RlmB [Vulcanimicrobiaceae bacterium]